MSEKYPRRKKYPGKIEITRYKRPSGLKSVVLRIGLPLIILSVFLAARPKAPDEKREHHADIVPGRTSAGHRESPAAEVKVLEDITRSPGTFLTVVIDDIGNTLRYQGVFGSLGADVTYAVLPLLPFSEKFSKMSKHTGAELILHLPVESLKRSDTDPGKVSPGMSREEVLYILSHDMKSVPHCKGVNNHKGSLGTADRELMDIIASGLKERGMFFLDSGTTSMSVAEKACGQFKVPFLKRDIFLDTDEDPKKIDEQIEKLADIAEQKGYAVGIGHYREETLASLARKIPELKAQGFKFISLTEGLKLADKRSVMFERTGK